MTYQKKKPHSIYSYQQLSLNIKTKQNCLENVSICFSLLGLVLIGGGVASLFLMKSLVQNMIASDMVLKQNGRAFLEWKDPDISPQMKIYFFNLTNAEMFLAGKEKPIMSKIGPYVYTQELHKVGTTFSEDGNTVTYSDNQKYFFNPISSKGKESDILLLPNIPLFGAMRNLTQADSTTKNIFEELIGSYQFDKNENAPFLMLTVKEFLWSYPSLLMAMKHTESEECNTESEESDLEWGNVDESDDWDEEEIMDECSISEETLRPFGFFLEENGTSKYPRTLMTGKTDIQDKGLYQAAFGKERMGSWSEDRCNVVQGRDPECPTINIEKNQTMDLYFIKMCRSIKFQNTMTVNHGGINTLRFSPSEDTFNNPKESPENSCYCHGETCQPSGVFDVGAGCNPGSPVYISWPHFLHGDPQLRQNVLGIDPPDESSHGFYMDFEPSWGIPLSVRVMLQFNVLVEKNGFSWFNNIQAPVVLPFMYIQAGFQEPSPSLLEKLNMLLSIADKIKNVTAASAISMGFLFMIPIIVFWSRYYCCQKMSQSDTNLKCNIVGPIF